MFIYLLIVKYELLWRIVWNVNERGKQKCWARKTLYSVGGRWMNEYGAMVE